MNSSLLPILCYHKVGRVEDEGRWLNVEAATLDSHVRFFSRRGAQAVQISALATDWPHRGVAYTFDDAYVSAMTNGLEVLRRHGVTATFYAVPSLVGKTSSWDGDRAQQLADWDALEFAQSAGFEIGNHTMTHSDLSRLDLRDQTEEWLAAHRSLEDKGIVARSACFPYGKFNGESTRSLEQAGYQVGVVLAKRRASTSDPRRQLPRIAVAYSDRVPKLLYKLYLRPLLR